MIVWYGDRAGGSDVRATPTAQSAVGEASRNFRQAAAILDWAEDVSDRASWPKQVWHKAVWPKAVTTVCHRLPETWLLGSLVPRLCLNIMTLATQRTTTLDRDAL